MTVSFVTVPIVTQIVTVFRCWVLAVIVLFLFFSGKVLQTRKQKINRSNMSKDLCKYIGMWGLRQCKAEQQEVDSYLNGADVEAGMEKFDEDTFKLIGVILC